MIQIEQQVVALPGSAARHDRSKEKEGALDNSSVTRCSGDVNGYRNGSDEQRGSRSG